MTEKYSYSLKTRGDGASVDVVNPKATKEEATALLILEAWASRKDEDVIDEPLSRRMHKATQDFVRECMHYREEYDKRQKAASKQSTREPKAKKLTKKDAAGGAG